MRSRSPSWYVRDGLSHEVELSDSMLAQVRVGLRAFRNLKSCWPILTGKHGDYEENPSELRSKILKRGLYRGII